MKRRKESVVSWGWVFHRFLIKLTSLCSRVGKFCSRSDRFHYTYIKTRESASYTRKKNYKITNRKQLNQTPWKWNNSELSLSKKWKFFTFPTSSTIPQSQWKPTVLEWRCLLRWNIKLHTAYAYMISKSFDTIRFPLMPFPFFSVLCTHSLVDVFCVFLFLLCIFFLHRRADTQHQENRNRIEQSHCCEML